MTGRRVGLRSRLHGLGVRGAGLRARVRGADLIPPVWHLVGWTVGVASASYLVRWLASVDGRTYTVVWLAAAPQLVALLTSRRRHWPVYLLSFAVFQYGPAWLLLGQRPELAALSTVTAVLFAAAVLHADRDWVSGRSESLRSWRRFVVYGVVVAPVFAGVIGAASVLVHQGTSGTAMLATTALIWYLAEAVGIAVLTPVLLRWRRYWRRYTGRQLISAGGFTLLMLGLGAVAAAESNFVLMSLTGVPALLMLIDFGIAAAFWQLAVGASVILGTTFAGLGPFSASASSPTVAMIHAQVFLLAGYAVVVMVAAALEERNRLSALDHVNHEIYDLVADLTGDLVLVLDSHGDVLHHAFAGNSDLELPQGRIRKAGWLNHVHPDDVHLIANRMTGGTHSGASLPFRLRARDGTWRWFVVHSRRAVRGLTAAILRDVTLVREMEDSLTDLAYSDALTGLANRRGLSQRAREIWLRAHELEQPLTALFVDVDHFKAFNDEFGHQAGDACLREVAEVLANLADPDSCVAGRYGGEEFAVVLAGCDDPCTFAAGLSSAIRGLAITHPVSSCGVVTISIGVATVYPRSWRGTDPDVAVSQLLDRADRALYTAKSEGRDTISVARDEASVGKQVHHAGEHAWEAAGSGHDD